MNDRPTVFILGGDDAARGSRRRLAKSMRLPVEEFASAEDFLDVFDPSRPGCLLLEVRPGETGDLALLEQLAQVETCPPLICISPAVEVPTVVWAMKAGAFDFLEESCGEESLREAIREALKQDADNRRRWRRTAKLRRRIDRLTPGERDVLGLLTRGESNRTIAGRLGRSVRAIEVRRAKVMRKMRAHSLAELVRITLLAEGGGLQRSSRASSDRPVVRTARAANGDP